MKELEFNTVVMPLVDKVNFGGILLTPKKIYYEWSRYMLSEMDYYNEPETEFFLLPQFDSPEETEEFCRLFFPLLGF